jgi:hypothetical protein
MRAAKRDSKNDDLDKKIMSFDLVDCLKVACHSRKRGEDHSVVVHASGKITNLNKTTESDVIRRVIDYSIPRIKRIDPRIIPYGDD